MRIRLFSLALLFVAASAIAQDYPNRAVRVIVPFPPGGAPDLVGRTLANRLGERLGQAFVVENRTGAGGNIAAEAVAKAVDSIQSHSTANPCSFAQKGALAALKGDQQPITDMRDEFDMRRNYMFDRISKIPNVTAVKPQGAFYVLVNISQLGLTSQNFADRLLSKANVAVVPGAAFGDDRTVRLSYATSIDIIKKGLDRFQDFCRTL